MKLHTRTIRKLSFETLTNFILTKHERSYGQKSPLTKIFGLSTKELWTEIRVAKNGTSPPFSPCQITEGTL